MLTSVRWCAVGLRLGRWWVGEGKGRIYRFFNPETRDQPIVREVQAILKDGFRNLTSMSWVRCWSMRIDGCGAAHNTSLAAEVTARRLPSWLATFQRLPSHVCSGVGPGSSSKVEGSVAGCQC